MNRRHLDFQSSALPTELPVPSEQTIKKCRNGEVARSEDTPIPQLDTPQEGPGTELKRILNEMGIRPSSCNCVKHAAEMNKGGVVWCRASVDTIAGWLEEEARKKGWLWQLAAKMTAKKLVLKAIEAAEARG